MGEQFVNYQIKSDSTHNVVNRIQYLIRTKAYVSPQKNGWITVYDEMSDSEYKYSEIRDLGRNISIELSTIVLTIIVFSGVNFLYFLDDSGELVDEFYDDPTRGFEFGFINATQAVVERFKGKPEKIIKYCSSKATIKSISYILKSCQEGKVEYLGGGGAEEFANLFGIDEERATNGYNYFVRFSLNEEDPAIEDAKNFFLVRKIMS